MERPLRRNFQVSEEGRSGLGQLNSDEIMPNIFFSNEALERLAAALDIASKN